MGRILDLNGKIFSHLTVIKYVGKNKHNWALWECLCYCGKTTIVYSHKLRNGATKSCGCLRVTQARDNFKTHGQSGTRFYKIWRKVHVRISNPRSIVYKYYGGRGIKVDKRWNSFENFYQDMFESYSEHVKDFSEKQTTLERIDNNGNYSKENCRWATRQEQMENRRNSIFFNFRGNRISLTKFCEINGLDYKLAHQRMSKLVKKKGPCA